MTAPLSWRPDRHGIQRPVRPRWYTVKEVAAMTRTSKMTVYRMCHSGELHSVRVRHSIRIPVAAVEAYLRRAEV